MPANLVPCPNGQVTSRLSPVKRDASSPVKRDASSLVKRDASSLVKRDASSPVKRDAGGPRSQRKDRLRDAQPCRCSRSDVLCAAHAAGL
jgi:hypothetical protein